MTAEPNAVVSRRQERSALAVAGQGWWDALPASPAVRVGDLLFIGGQIAVADDGHPIAPGDVRAQARHLFGVLDATARAAGGGLRDVVDIVSFHADVRQIDEVLEVAREFLDGDYPAWTCAGFSGAPVPGALVQLRAIAHLGTGSKQCIVPESQAWLRSLPVSSAVRKGPYVFVSGQSAADRSGRCTGLADHCRQARAAYGRIHEVLALAGAAVADVLDFSSFHRDIRGAIPTLEQVYMPEVIGMIDTDAAPTTSHIGTTGLLRPGMLGAYGALADLSAGARIGATPDAIWWKGTYPIAGAAKKSGGRLITVAGQVASGSDGAIVAEGDVEGQARYIFETMRDSLAGLGASMADVVEVSSFHKDPRWFAEVLAVSTEFFTSDPRPTWTYAAVPGLWMEGYLHEISALAVI